MFYKRGFQVVIAMILSLLMTFNSAYSMSQSISEIEFMTSEAQHIEEVGITIPDQVYIEEAQYDENEIIAEDISKRTETSKTFVQANGIYVLQDYGVPIHYLDNGNYYDIDNTINDKFENTANSFSVTFNDGSRESLVSLTDGRGAINMTPVFDLQKTNISTGIYVYDGQKKLTVEKSVNQKSLSKDIPKSKDVEDRIQSVNVAEDTTEYEADRPIKKDISIDFSIMNLNPFRYRGYYYDKDTKLMRITTKNNQKYIGQMGFR